MGVGCGGGGHWVPPAYARAHVIWGSRSGRGVGVGCGGGDTASDAEATTGERPATGETTVTLGTLIEQRIYCACACLTLTPAPLLTFEGQYLKA